jgi:hypothetical protein
LKRGLLLSSEVGTVKANMSSIQDIHDGKLVARVHRSDIIFADKERIKVSFRQINITELANPKLYYENNT